MFEAHFNHPMNDVKEISTRIRTLAASPFSGAQTSKRIVATKHRIANTLQFC